MTIVLSVWSLSESNGNTIVDPVLARTSTHKLNAFAIMKGELSTSIQYESFGTGPLQVLITVHNHVASCDAFKRTHVQLWITLQLKPHLSFDTRTFVFIAI